MRTCEPLRPKLELCLGLSYANPSVKHIEDECFPYIAPSLFLISVLFPSPSLYTVSTDIRSNCLPGSYIRSWVMIITPYNKQASPEVAKLTEDIPQTEPPALPPPLSEDSIDSAPTDEELSQEIIEYVSICARLLLEYDVDIVNCR